MRQHYNRLLIFAAFLTVVLLLPACAVQMKDYTGKAAAPIHALLAEPRSGQWETNDLQIMYTIVESSPVFLKGSMSFKSYLRYSFPLVEKFRLSIHYLDEDRIVIASRDISPLIGYRHSMPESVNLPDVPPGPSGTRYFAFSYQGSFHGVNDSDGNIGNWEIYFDPFDKGM